MPTDVVEAPTSLDLLASRSRLRLLRYLLGHSGPHTGRQLARAVGLEPKRAAEALRYLVDSGAVARARVGRAHLYSVNRTDYLVETALAPAFQAERKWAEQLGEEVRRAGGKGVRAVLLYGSWARGEAAQDSDIDLLVVVSSRKLKPGVEQRLADERGRLLQRFARQISLLVMTRATLRRRARRGDPLVREILRDGRPLAGVPLSELLAHD